MSLQPLMRRKVRSASSIPAPTQRRTILVSFQRFTRAVVVRTWRLAARAHRAHELAVDLQRDAAGEARGAVQGEGPEPSAGHLLLHLAARADEDRSGARLVHGHPRARDLGALGAMHRDQLAGRVDDRDHHPVAVLVRVALGGGDDRVRAGVVDRPSRPHDGH
jgi:hypothetical protein